MQIFARQFDFYQAFIILKHLTKIYMKYKIAPPMETVKNLTVTIGGAYYF